MDLPGVPCDSHRPSRPPPLGKRVPSRGAPAPRRSCPNEPRPIFDYAHAICLVLLAHRRVTTGHHRSNARPCPPDSADRAAHCYTPLGRTLSRKSSRGFPPNRQPPAQPTTPPRLSTQHTPAAWLPDAAAGPRQPRADPPTNVTPPEKPTRVPAHGRYAAHCPAQPSDFRLHTRPTIGRSTECGTGDTRSLAPCATRPRRTTARSAGRTVKLADLLPITH